MFFIPAAEKKRTMAHLIQLSGQTDNLIRSILPPSIESNPIRLISLRKSILQALLHHNFARTNHFDIERQLDGLEEKFLINGNDSLADAIHRRRNELKNMDAKWQPEVLQLLLELSDRPLLNSKLDDPRLQKELLSKNTSPLQWSDLALDDPRSQEECIWENVDFANQSTDDETELVEVLSHVDLPESTNLSCLDEDSKIHLENCVASDLDRENFKRSREAQFWQKGSNVYNIRNKKSITHLQAIRELLFMFGGYPTSLFKIQSQSPVIIQPSEDFTLEHFSQFSYSSLFESLANQGAAIMTLRFWTKDWKKTALIQVLQLTIQERLAEFDAILSKIHQIFMSPTQDVAVSILGLKQQLVSITRPLTYLAEITNKLDKTPYGHSFRYLEMLYEKICISQMAGDDLVYSFLGKVFFDCFQVYLRPIRAWIEEGELTNGDTSFFITEITGNTEPTLLWESRFKIRTTPDGVVHAPRFLEPAANKIITMGKSIIVLKLLNQSDSLQSTKKNKEPILNFETVCGSAANQLAPFSELFSIAFDGWVRSKHHHTTSILRDTLFSSCGLHHSLDALARIYFLADGSVGSNFLNPIFANLDALKGTWNNRFTLTEHAQSVFSSVTSIHSERLQISDSVFAPKYQDVKKCRKTVKALCTIELDYQLLWPIQIVITPATILLYQRIFTFLVQVRRSSYILSRQSMKVCFLNDTSNTDERALYYSLRMRLLWFSQTLYYYLTSLVLGQCSQKMQVELKAAEDVDTIIEVHSIYVKRCIDQSLLGSRLELIHKTILRILDLGIKLEDIHGAKMFIGGDITEQPEDTMHLSITSLDSDIERQNESPVNSLSQFFEDISDDSNNLEGRYYQGDVDQSMMSHFVYDSKSKELGYAAQLRHTGTEFYRLLNFVASGLKGIARAAGSEDARLWDKLGEMFESGLKSSELKIKR